MSCNGGPNFSLNPLLSWVPKLMHDRSGAATARRAHHQLPRTFSFTADRQLPLPPTAQRMVR